MTRKADPNCPACHGEGYDGSPIYGIPCPICFPEESTYLAQERAQYGNDDDRETGAMGCATIALVFVVALGLWIVWRALG